MFSLERLELITKKNPLYLKTDIADMKDSNSLVTELAKNYKLNPKTTRVIINPNFAIIYDVNDNIINIGDLLFNTKIEIDEEVDITDKVMMQINIAINQIKKDKEIDISSLDENQRKMYNSSLNLEEKKSINKIINNVLLVDKKNLSNNIKPILKNIKISIKDNQDILLQANKIDTKNNNAFQLSFDIIDNIFKRVEKENIFYKDVTLLQKDDNKKIIYGKQIMDYGNVVIITDGNPYLSLEMILRNIIAGNTIVLVNNGFMYGTNNLIVNIVQSILENYKVSKNLIQLFITDDYKEVLNNYANIDLVVCIGNHELQRLIIRESKNKVITSGYENFDLYIEDTKHLDFLNKIINTGLNVNLYINKDTNLDYDTAIIVSDIDEAIAQINYNGSRYSSAIFTSSNFNASKFIREVKSSIVTVNTSPTIERICDIKQLDLVYEKTIIYPYEFNIEKIVK